MKRKWIYWLIFLIAIAAGGYAVLQQFNSQTDNKLYKKLINSSLAKQLRMALVSMA